MKLSDLEGDHILSGIEHDVKHKDIGNGISYPYEIVKFTLDGTTYSIHEEMDDDSYYASELEIVEEIHFRNIPDIRVTCCMAPSIIGFTTGANEILDVLDSETLEILFRVGTNSVEDDTPFWVFEYYPENMQLWRKEVK